MAGKWNQSTSNISICRFYMILCYVFVIFCPSSRVTKKSNLPFNLPAVLFNALDILGSVSLACHSGKACLKRHGMLFGSAITAPGGTELHLSQKWLSDWRPLRTSVCRTPAWRAEPGALSRIWGVHLSTPTPLTLKSPAGSPCQVDVSMAWAPLNVACNIRYIRGIVYSFIPAIDVGFGDFLLMWVSHIMTYSSWTKTIGRRSQTPGPHPSVASISGLKICAIHVNPNIEIIDSPSILGKILRFTTTYWDYWKY